ncbi:XDD3 family exosortase-dependent surface protein [Aerosakkonemataceae cyanobacterium BLCC-F50]|uniref:XDD3 family exosortase-dependent surface protein n=1 Tax=Floridaenema flaviceps BLCC-F50 TaxID=3153642 RepID=A0ABV4XYN0_9CYAN
MNSRVASTLLKTFVASIGIISFTGQAANAGVLTNGTIINTFIECLNDGIALEVGSSPAQNGWYYATDSSNDGSGGPVYEIYGMGIKETESSIMVALRANMPLRGNNTSGAADRNIGWGDMFFNFSGLNFMDAMNQGQLFGVRFAGTNDSGVSQVGLYSGVIAKSVTAENSGYASINAYNNSMGSRVGLGDLAPNTNYFDKTKSLNAIAAGTFLSGINFLNNTQLTAAGFNLSKFGGSQTIAFSIDKFSLPGASVPEPSAIFGLAAIGAFVFASKLGQQRAIGS